MVYVTLGENLIMQQAEYKMKLEEIFEHLYEYLQT